METEISWDIGDCCQVHTFNFLASLINGNDVWQRLLQIVYNKDSFNFLASLINGNES